MKRLLRESLLASFVLISIGMQGACGKEPAQQAGGKQDSVTASPAASTTEPPRSCWCPRRRQKPTD